ncbi:hypothetical protein C440_14714 [Haloferax mucosum ATCC BAA-1512]|uniref:Uncharacterized protein n=1 Tax=Haloferax mucosum ATCC BAA-1512 TaxID=662479 RepID=M0I474_9EURY|nr:hypothetical protein C440_14714 [Haloferax mucosum ATCC BAA-1512]
MVLNVAFNTGLAPFEFDPTPFVSTISMLLFIPADVQYGMFRAHPLARDIAREHVMQTDFASSPGLVSTPTPTLSSGSGSGSSLTPSPSQNPLELPAAVGVV